MMAASYLLLLTSALALVSGQRYSRGEAAKKKCESYGKMCPYNKICVIQHIQVPRKMSIPVCIFKVQKPVNSEICKLPPDHGKCGARFVRWYFNRHSQQCSWFHYSGCSGNRNRFTSKESCEDFCISHNSALQMVPQEIRANPVNAFNSYNDADVYLKKYNDIESEWDGVEETGNDTSPMMAKLANNLVLTVTTNPLDTLQPLSWYKKRRCLKWKRQNRRLCTKKNWKHRGYKKQRKNRVSFLRKETKPLSAPTYAHSPRGRNSSHRGRYRYLPNRANGHKLFSILKRPFHLKVNHHKLNRSNT
ncbi:Kunitz-type serine protease inhibitor [Octopus vulgaris]|uniref:Kunitz-type serine protease inhibitor n=1 Tax=Octopus vulgaris TaxID=6645 RepID=A0AA36APB7_OCTVU|nr:Kunitz-type serine protease inhibitor [Octopus vulgaris]